MGDHKSYANAGTLVIYYARQYQTQHGSARQRHCHGWKEFDHLEKPVLGDVKKRRSRPLSLNFAPPPRTSFFPSKRSFFFLQLAIWTTTPQSRPWRSGQVRTDDFVYKTAICFHNPSAKDKCISSTRLFIINTSEEPVSLLRCRINL